MRRALRRFVGEGWWVLAGVPFNDTLYYVCRRAFGRSGSGDELFEDPDEEEDSDSDSRKMVGS